jgi:DNA-binding response OmpR family regulator
VLSLEAEPDNDRMRKPRCLIVEDQALIGMSLEAFLEDQGYDVVGPFLRKGPALDWLKSDTPELALLDVMLPDGSSVELAAALKDRGVPFAIYSGLKPDRQAPEFRDAPWIEKPMSRQALARVLARLAPLSTREPASDPPAGAGG